MYRKWVLLHLGQTVLPYRTATKVEVEKTKQETHKIIAQFDNYGAVIDDQASLYSVGKVSVHAEQSETHLDFTNIDLLIEQKKFGDMELSHLELKHDQPSEIEYLKQLAKKSKNVKEIAVINFTSGTSSNPKAVLLNHQNAVTGLACLGRQFVPYHLNDKGAQSSTISYLPLAHVFQHCLETGMIFRGQMIYYSSGNIKNLTQDIQLSKPSFMIGVPRVYSKIHQSVMGKLRKSGIMKRAVFQIAFQCKKFYLSFMKNGVRNPSMPVVDLVFKQIRDALGGNMEFMVSGSSALTKDTRQFLEVCSGARITVGYGLTECSSTGAYNYCGQKMNDANQLGFMPYLTEGRVIECNQCEFSLEKDHIGELQIKGLTVAQGYVGEKYGKVIKITDKDGWYSTGDLVKRNDDGSVSFIRRISLVVKLQHGEFVDLEQIENALESDPLITTAIVHAEADKSAPVAIVSVDSTVLKSKVGEDVVEKFKQNDKDAVKAVTNLLLQTGDQAVRMQGLKGFNVPKAYKAYLDVDWTTNTEFYTPSQKKKHQPFVNAHKHQIQKLWEFVATNDFKSQTKIEVSSNKKWMIMGAVLLIAAVAFALLK